MSGSRQKLSTNVMTAFVIAGGAIVALLMWALSLRSENAALREELGLGAEEVVVGPPARTDAGATEGTEGEGTTADANNAGTGSTAGDDGDPTPPTAPSAPSHLDAASRRTLVEQLRTVPDGPTHKRVWFTVTFGDPRAVVLQEELAAAFREAGFTIPPVRTAGFPIRPGLYFMMADEEPTEDVGAIGAALEAAGLTLTTGRGYRSFYQEKKRTDPAWNGFAMDDDQPYVVAIGRIAD